MKEQKGFFNPNLKSLLGVALQVTACWLAFLIFFIVLSMINIRISEKDWSVGFQVTTTSALLAALIWLLGLLGILGLSGGTAKVPGGLEFTSKGIVSALVDIQRMLDASGQGALMTLVEQAAERGPPDRRPEIEQAQRALTDEFAARIPPDRARADLEALAREYRALRKGKPPGAQRTLEFGSVMERMRALATKAGLTPEQVDAYLRSEDEGEALLGLAAVLAHGGAANFDSILRVFENPKSAFEQYQALRTLDVMVQHLDAQQAGRLEDAIQKQRDYDESKKQWIKPGTDRDRLAERIRARLRSPALA